MEEQRELEAAKVTKLSKHQLRDMEAAIRGATEAEPTSGDFSELMGNKGALSLDERQAEAANSV